MERTTKTQIRMRICAFWSASLFCAHKTRGRAFAIGTMVWLRRSYIGFRRSISTDKYIPCTVDLINLSTTSQVLGTRGVDFLFVPGWGAQRKNKQTKVLRPHFIHIENNDKLTLRHMFRTPCKVFPTTTRERSGSVVECLTRDRRVASSSLTGVTALWSLSKTHLS